MDSRFQHYRKFAMAATKRRTVRLGFFATLLCGVTMAACSGNGGGAVTPAATQEASTATPSAATPTPLASICPVDDEPFCDFAESVDAALRQGDIDSLIENTRIASIECSGAALTSVCSGQQAGTVLEGYQIGFDGTGGIPPISEEAYRSVLGEISSDGGVGSDEFGDATWRIAAILDQRSDLKMLLSTTIAPDPIFNERLNERRVYLWLVTLDNGNWQLDFLLTTRSDRDYLTGVTERDIALDDWIAWGMAPPVAPAPNTLDSVCPVDDEAFCGLAKAVDAAVRSGDIDVLVENTRIASFECIGGALTGPCLDQPAGTVLEGYEFGVDRSERGPPVPEDAYRSVLAAVADGNGAQTDAFGSGTWHVVAVLDQSDDFKVLLTTTIASDPIYEEASNERRVFFWGVFLNGNAWELGGFLTTIFDQDFLTGRTQAGFAVENWLAWGGQTQP